MAEGNGPVHYWSSLMCCFRIEVHVMKIDLIAAKMQPLVDRKWIGSKLFVAELM